MSQITESLKSDLIAQVQLGRDAQRLIETQSVLIGKIKESIFEELALISTPKQVEYTSFFGLKIRKEIRGGLERVEALQSDLRVINGYQALLNNTLSDAEVARLNLEGLNARD